MTNKEILRKAIEKAVKNRFDVGINNWEVANDLSVGAKYQDGCENMVWLAVEKSLNDIIFSHDFAKAYWGLYRVNHEGTRKISGSMYVWEYHLKQMVVLGDDERFRYLAKFL